MRASILLSGLFMLSAAGLWGCGGGPCADYCDASFSCVGCDLADPGNARAVCSDACQAGLDAVPDATGRQAVQDCLQCISPIYKADCQLDDQTFLQCQDQCIDAAEPIQIWVAAFSTEIEGETIVCADGTPIGGGDCSFSSGGDGTSDTCSVECESGDMMAGAECVGTAGDFTCQCTVGPKQGTSFSADCETLDENTVWELCN
jgi:hypothetical protein